MRSPLSYATSFKAPARLFLGREEAFYRASTRLAATLARDGALVRPEVPFLLELGGTVVRGKVDLLAETPEGPLVVDYKTDALGGADPVELA